MHRPLCTGRCGPAVAHPLRLQASASSSYGRHEYSQCTRQTLDRRQTSSDAHRRLMPPTRRGGAIKWFHLIFYHFYDRLAKSAVDAFSPVSLTPSVRSSIMARATTDSVRNTGTYVSVTLKLATSCRQLVLVQRFAVLGRCSSAWVQLGI